MGLISNLAVGITATTGAFAAKMRAATKPVREFANAVTSERARLVGFFSGVATAAAGALASYAVVHRIAETSETIDKMAKLSDRLGSTTEELAGLKLAADLSGVAFDELATASEKLTKNLGNPSQEVTEALDALGLEAKDLKGLGVEKQMELLANRFQLVASNEDKAAYATALFGRAGQALLPMLNDGAGAMQQAAKDAARLGLTFSRIDAAQVEAANDAITRMQGAIEGVQTKLAIQSAPFIEALADKLTNFITDFGGVGKVIEGIFTGIAATVRMIGRAFTLVQSSFEGLKETGSLIGQKYNEFGAALAHFFGSTDVEKEQRDRAEAYGKSRSQAGFNRAGLLEQFDMGDTPGDALADSLAKWLADVKDNALKRAQERAKELSQNQDDAKFFDFMMNDVGKAFDDADADLAEYQKQIARRDEDMRRSSSTFGKYDPTAVPEGYSPKREPVLHLAEMGTRGTFAADAASRLVGSANVPMKQLQALLDIHSELQDLNDNFDSGVPLG
jgi:hypothetical protein